LLAIGPIASTFTMYSWIYYKRASMPVTQTLQGLACLAHGAFLASMSWLAEVNSDANVVKLPPAFSSVLYLDVFGWVKEESHQSGEMTPQSAVSAVEQSNSPALPRAASDSNFEDHWGHEVSDDRGYLVQEYMSARSALTSQDTVGGGARDPVALRPSSHAVTYTMVGRPVPQRSEDFAPTGAVQDLRSLPGAPEQLTEANPAEYVGAAFFNADSWLRQGAGGAATTAGGETDEAEAPALPGDVGQSPNTLPRYTFSVALRSVCIAWFVAAAYFFICAASGWNPEAALANLEDLALVQITPSRGSTTPASRHGGGDRSIRLELVQASWPEFGSRPRGLACDASGHHFLVLDGLVMFAGELEVSQAKPSLHGIHWGEVHCPELDGEGLQDVSVSCVREDCEALVLHGHGGRVSTCQLAGGQTAALTFSANVSDAWLDRQRDVAGMLPNRALLGAPHTRVEKVVAIADASCDTSPSQEERHACAILATTQGRIVQVHQSRGQRTYWPQEAISNGEKSMTLGQGSVRLVDHQFLGVLQHDGRSIGMLDRNSGDVAGRVTLPERSMASGFCIGGGFVYLLSGGSDVQLWRFPLPSNLAASYQLEAR